MTEVVKLWVQPRNSPNKRRVADLLDREYLASYIGAGKTNIVVVNDEKLEDGSVLMTVTHKAWEEMNNIV